MKSKQIISKFTQKISTSNCLFLQEYSKYLNDCYNDDEFEYKPVNDNRMEILLNFMDSIEFLQIMPDKHDSSQNRGCALFGETFFDKLEFTKLLLESYGYKEYSDNGITSGRYVVVDCERKAKRENTIISYAQKYRDVPFVIFENCESILKNDGVLVAFKHFIEYRRSTGLPDNSTYESWYILLGNENKIPELMKKAKPGYGIQDHINAFACFIKIHNFYTDK